MAEVTAVLVKELREKTGAGMMDCKRALDDSAGDIEAAVDWLRKKGLAAPWVLWSRSIRKPISWRATRPFKALSGA